MAHKYIWPKKAEEKVRETKKVLIAQESSRRRARVGESGLPSRFWYSGF
jgi:hypothetical protein